jgi:hypothetical protein
MASAAFEYGVSLLPHPWASMLLIEAIEALHCAEYGLARCCAFLGTNGAGRKELLDLGEAFVYRFLCRKHLAVESLYCNLRLQGERVVAGILRLLKIASHYVHRESDRATKEQECDNNK